MENELGWEQSTLMRELIQGMEVARRLKTDLRTPSSAETRGLLVQRILSSYEKALLILRWNASNSKPLPTAGWSPESPISVNTSPLREDVDGDLKDHPELKQNSKKRKMMPRWMDHVRVSSETGLEGPQDDGYSWRKYGQKDILGAKYPRSYYRCTFRNTQNCWATKQVQRSEEDPTIFDITYRGKHVCSLGNNAVPPPKSPDKQEKPHDYNSDIHHEQPSQKNLEKIKNNLSVNTDNLGDEETAYPFTFPSNSFDWMTQANQNLLPFPLENDPFFNSFPQNELLSPNTPEPNYLSSLSFKMNEFYGTNNQPCSESDIAEVISAPTSATSSPIVDFNFPIDPNFPFDTPGLFS